jgi:hypothetical protein
VVDPTDSTTGEQLEQTPKKSKHSTGSEPVSPPQMVAPTVYDGESTTSAPLVLFDSEENADEINKYFISQALASDGLMRCLHPENRTFAYILEMHLAIARARETTDTNLCIDITQFDLMRQCLVTHSLSDAYGVVCSHFGLDNVDETLRSTVVRLLPHMSATPKPSSCSDPDLALSVAHLHSACHRIGVKISSRSEMEATYLGQYVEVQEAFADRASMWSTWSETLVAVLRVY